MSDDNIFDELLDSGTDDARKSELLTLRTLIKNEHGRRWAYNFLSGCGVFFVNHTDCAINNAFENGKKARGFEMLNELKKADYHFFMLMMKENDPNAN